MSSPSTSIDLGLLQRFSTPTVANAIELFEIRPGDEGYLRPGLQCLLPDAPPVAGFAATCMYSSGRNLAYGKVESFDYWEHVESVPGPRIAVWQDIDPYPGTGCPWGEVQSNIHKVLGCAGAVTNGALRDIEEVRGLGFPMLYGHTCVSRSFVHLVDYGIPLSFHGVVVKPGDLIQMDRHGALIVPLEVMPHLDQAIAEIERRERPVIDYCKGGTATRAGLVEMATKHLRNHPRWTPGA
jgi:4-hydroxy-4-methyl-2-oxoglutarate aldolase